MKLKLVKEIFVLEIEQGREVSIPKELNQNDLPYSFRYYDPLITFIQETVSKQRKTYHHLK
jgi:hypothetical protein